MRALRRRNLLPATPGTAYFEPNADPIHLLLHIGGHDLWFGVSSFQLSVVDRANLHLPVVILGTEIYESDDSEEPHAAQREEQTDSNHLQFDTGDNHLYCCGSKFVAAVAVVR
jgi:hypothetical protein